MKEQTHEEPTIMAAAERQMRDWAMHEEQLDRAGRQDAAQQVRRKLHRYVTISREPGAGGSEIAQLVGAKLGWEVLDGNLLDRIAERFREDRQMLALVDETESNWVFDVLGTWMDRSIIPHEKYVAQLTRVVLAAARCTHAVFVGRGAQYILPRDRGLAVRLIAPESFRLERTMRLLQVDAPAARRAMQELERGRSEFISRFFHRQPNDPRNYDLIINVGQFGVVASAEMIVAAVRSGE